MINLLRADFSRLLRNKLFWCFSAFLFALSIWYCIGSGNVILPQKESYTVYPFEAMPISEFAISVFTAFFIDVNFSSKVISNKLSSGASKAQIYISNAILSFTVSVFFSLFFVVAGIRLMMSGKFPAGIYLAFVLVGMILSVTFSTLSTFFAFILRRSSVASIVSIALIVVMFFATNILGSTLGQSKFAMIIETVNGVPYNNAEVIPNDAEITYTEIPNQLYCGGVKRTVYQFISDLLPTSNLSLLSNLNIDSDNNGVWFSPGWSDTVQVKSAAEVFDYINIAYPLGLSVFITALGVLLFRKKDIN